MTRSSVCSLTALSVAALMLAGCGGGGNRAAPSAQTMPQFAYYDARGNLVYRGGPLYDSNGSAINPVDPRQVSAPQRSAPPVITPVVAPGARTQPQIARPQAPAAQPRLPFQTAPDRAAALPQRPTPPAAPQRPAPQPPRAFPQSPGGPRFDASGNLIQQNDGVVAPRFDDAGNLLQPGESPAPAPAAAAPAFSAAAAPAFSPAQIETAAVQGAPTPPQAPRQIAPQVSYQGSRQAAQDAAPNSLQAPQVSYQGARQAAQDAAPTSLQAPQVSYQGSRQAAPTRAKAPGRQAPAPTRISGDPRATAGYDVSGTSWIVKAIGGRPVGGGMTLYFVTAGDQRMAIVESVCDQEIGAFEGGRGGALAISGLVGCDADRGLTGALSSVRRFAVSGDKQRMQLIDESGAPIAELSNLVSS